jgi:uncharacterized protein (DUF305 family)
MQIKRLLRGSALLTILSLSPVAAQDAEHQEHHPGTTAEPTTGPTAAPPATKPAQEAIPSAADPGTAMGQGTGTMPPGASSGPNMAMMRECMGMMGNMMQGMGQGQMAAAAPDDPVEGAFGAINRRMHRNMAIPAGGSPDAVFAQAMIAHHQGAIDMARVILGFGSDLEIRKLAQEVITAQQGEIAFLQQWMARQPKP